MTDRPRPRPIPYRITVRRIKPAIFGSRVGVKVETPRGTFQITARSTRDGLRAAHAYLSRLEAARADSRPLRAPRAPRIF